MGSVTNLRENKTLFIPCDCESEVLAIVYDHATKMADISIYETMASFKHKLSLWQRIRYCWRVLIDKKLYPDQMSLKHKQLDELRKFLSVLDLN